MRYDEQPDQDYGLGAFDTDPEQQAARHQRPSASAAQPSVPQGGGMAAPRQPQTFSQMQKAGMARPPMGGLASLMSRMHGRSATGMPHFGGLNGVFRKMQQAQAKRRAPTAQMGPGAMPMSSSPGGEQAVPAGPGSIVTSTAPSSAPAPSGAPTQPTNAFDPMEWFRQQVMGGSDDALKRSQAYLGGQIDDQFSLKEQELRDEMAARGLGDSTVYGGRMQDLNVARRSAQSDLGERLALDDLNRKQGMVQNMANLDENTRQYLLQLLNVGYGG